MSDTQLKEQPQAGAAPTSESRRCRMLDAHERFVVRRWWQRLALSDREAKSRHLPPPWPRGVRAILRRCETPDAAVLTEGFRKLWQMLDDEAENSSSARPRRRDIQAWACVALIAAQLDDDTPGSRPAQAFARQRKETGKPNVSELRFQQLQQSQSLEELTRRLRRALAMVGDAPISVVDLADDVLLWCRENTATAPISARRVDERIAFRWANDYFTTLARYASHD